MLAQINQLLMLALDLVNLVNIQVLAQVHLLMQALHYSCKQQPTPRTEANLLATVLLPSLTPHPPVHSYVYRPHFNFVT